MGAEAFRSRAARQPHRGVRCLGERVACAGRRAPASGCLRCDFLRLTGRGHRPPGVMPSSIPRTYLVAGTAEPFFLENAVRWADALGDAGADVVMRERPGSHGDAFWQKEFPLMVAWAFGE